MFWTDWGDLPKIERCSMDGDPSSRVTLADHHSVTLPNALTLDYEDRRLYWTEAREDDYQIWGMDWDGGKRFRIGLQREHMQQPYSISFWDKQLLWTTFDSRFD